MSLILYPKACEETTTAKISPLRRPGDKGHTQGGRDGAGSPDRALFAPFEKVGCEERRIMAN
jgi:hypothetical protein